MEMAYAWTPARGSARYMAWPSTGFVMHECTSVSVQPGVLCEICTAIHRHASRVQSRLPRPPFCPLCGEPGSTSRTLLRCTNPHMNKLDLDHHHRALSICGKGVSFGDSIPQIAINSPVGSAFLLIRLSTVFFINVTMGFDLQPGSLVAQPAQLFQLHKKYP
eukprot:644605-Pelagomonas_calceolata.AAC.1